MKKINTMLATLAAFLMLSVTSANSIEFKLGASLNSMAAYANAQEKLKDSGRITNEERVLATSYESGFLEVGTDALMGLALGISYAPDVADLDTETRVIQASATGDTGTQLVAANIVDLVEVYATLPIGEGAFVRAGYIEATMQTKENLATGSTYKDVDMTGVTVGAGIERDLGDMLFWRAEGAYQMWDDIEAGGSEAGGSGNTNKITAELGALTGTLSIGAKF
tara:strand:- start:426 stop:1097 length:672 start_codon:yes stop_codon:yes gene_type:complete